MIPTVFIIDDDPLSRESTAALVESMNQHAVTFASAESFLRYVDDRSAGCVVTDLRMPGMNGIELLEAMRKHDLALPVILVTAYARTHLTVRALRGGALTVLEKPCDDQVLWDAIREALEVDRVARARRLERDEIAARFARLTDQERSVLDGILKGQTNREIAAALDVSTRTIEARRHHIFRKTRTGSVAELVQLAVRVLQPTVDRPVGPKFRQSPMHQGADA